MSRTCGLSRRLVYCTKADQFYGRKDFSIRAVAGWKEIGASTRYLDNECSDDFEFSREGNKLIEVSHSSNVTPVRAIVRSPKDSIRIDGRISKHLATTRYRCRANRSESHPKLTRSLLHFLERWESTHAIPRRRNELDAILSKRE